MILPMQSMARVNDNILKREKLKKLIRLEKKKRTSSLAEMVDVGLFFNKFKVPFSYRSGDLPR